MAVSRPVSYPQKTAQINTITKSKMAPHNQVNILKATYHNIQNQEALMAIFFLAT